MAGPLWGGAAARGAGTIGPRGGGAAAPAWAAAGGRPGGVRGGVRGVVVAGPRLVIDPLPAGGSAVSQRLWAAGRRVPTQCWLVCQPPCR